MLWNSVCSAVVLCPGCIRDHLSRVQVHNEVLTKESSLIQDLDMGGGGGGRDRDRKYLGPIWVQDHVAVIISIA